MLLQRYNNIGRRFLRIHGTLHAKPKAKTPPFFFQQQSGVTGDASSCDRLPPAEGREYNKALEEEWGNRAVSALREPLPSPSPSPSSDTKAAAAAAAGTATATAEVETAVSGGEVRAGASEGEVSLLLACLCRGLETTFVVRVPEILGRCGRVWLFRGMLFLCSCFKSE